jgi:hypothetical protein
MMPFHKAGAKGGAKWSVWSAVMLLSSVGIINVPTHDVVASSHFLDMLKLILWAAAPTTWQLQPITGIMCPFTAPQGVNTGGCSLKVFELLLVEGAHGMHAVLVSSNWLMECSGRGGKAELCWCC